MGIAIFTFAVIFLLIVSGGLLLFYREEMLQRISEAINPRPKQKSLLTAIQQTGLSIGGVVEHFENVLPKSQAEVSVALQRLQRAGVEHARDTVRAVRATVEQGFQVDAGDRAVALHARLELHQDRMAPAMAVEHFFSCQADFDRPIQ